MHHPNYAGAVETLSEDGYDVVCCVGYRQNTRGNATDLRFASAGTIIGIGHDPSQLGNTFALDIAVWGNVRHTLSALNASWKDADARQPHLERRRTDVRARGEQRIRKLHDEAMALATDKPIHPNYVAHVAGEVLPGNTMIVSESFRNADHLMPFGLDKNQWRLVRSFGASLGYGIGAAVGAQLGAPDRPCVCSLGDGAVMYSASGFWTMARYGLPILTIVWNNLNYQTVRTNFHTFGGEMAKQKKYPEVYLGEPEIDFVMLAKAQGIQGSEVREPKDLKAALRRGVDAITAGEPYVLDVRVATVGTGAESTWHQRFKLRAGVRSSVRGDAGLTPMDSGSGRRNVRDPKRCASRRPGRARARLRRSARRSPAAACRAPPMRPRFVPIFRRRPYRRRGHGRRNDRQGLHAPSVRSSGAAQTMAGARCLSPARRSSAR